MYQILRPSFSLAMAVSMLALATPASAADAQGCTMQKQCKWVNFQKVCVWVKVCR